MSTTQAKKGFRQPKKPTKKAVQAENDALKQNLGQLQQGMQFLAQNMTKMTREIQSLGRETQAMANLLRTESANDSSVQMGDQIMIDFTGSLLNEDGSEGDLVPNGHMLGSVIEVGSGNFIEGFESSMIGAKKGETKVLDLAFPEEYQAKELAGKPVRFTVKVINIWRKAESDSEVADLHKEKAEAQVLRVNGPRSADLPMGGPTRAMIAQAEGKEASEITDEMVTAEHEKIRAKMAEAAEAAKEAAPTEASKEAPKKATKKKATKKKTKKKTSK